MIDAEREQDRGVTARIANALRASGFHSLDAQARALGLCRSTTWTIVASQHKIGRLSTKVLARMLANPELPPLVRAAIEGRDETGPASLDQRGSEDAALLQRAVGEN
jgi:hypothetical protein